MANLDLYGHLFWYNGYEELWYAIPRDEVGIFFSGYVDRSSFLSAEKMERLISNVIELERSKSNESNESDFEKLKNTVEEVIICDTCGREKVKDFDNDPGFDCHACL